MSLQEKDFNFSVEDGNDVEIFEVVSLEQPTMEYKAPFQVLITSVDGKETFAVIANEKDSVGQLKVSASSCSSVFGRLMPKFLFFSFFFSLVVFVAKFEGIH